GEGGASREWATIRESGPEEARVGKPVASAEGPTLAEHRETPEPDPEWEPFVARLMARSLVEVEKDGRRYAALRDDPAARVWRCGSCTEGIITATPRELLPRVGWTCTARQAT